MTANVQLVERAFEAYLRRDLDDLLAMMHPDVEVLSLMTEAERSTYRGHEGVREWFNAVLEIFPDWEPRIESSREAGQGVVACFHVNATAAASGVPIDQTYWQAACLRDGKVAWFGFFRSEEEALEAVP